jgi:hypothetical protein
MKSLGLDAIHFLILTIVRLRFSNVLGRFFRLKLFHSSVFARRENQSTRAGSCVSQRTVAFQSGPDAKKQARFERFLSQSDCFILTNKK